MQRDGKTYYTKITTLYERRYVHCDRINRPVGKREVDGLSVFIPGPSLAKLQPAVITAKHASKLVPTVLSLFPFKVSLNGVLAGRTGRPMRRGYVEIAERGLLFARDRSEERGIRD